MTYLHSGPALPSFRTARPPSRTRRWENPSPIPSPRPAQALQSLGDLGFSEPSEAEGGWAVAATDLLICFAAHNASSRAAYALAQEGVAPKWFGALHLKYGTPVGGLIFIAAGRMGALLPLYSEAVSLAELIALPNAAFIAAYIGGCMPCVRLLRDSRWGRSCAVLSLAAVLALYPLLGWPALYPAGAAIGLYVWRIRHA
ncbi:MULTISPECIES: APC family permease [Paenibacillus]|uniref:hypothetical protein n=1 Tax=Paenibacillus TaxID=44249 RepID=UPI0022B8BF05|nr:hypothetical protein [Paenibacillus caseinilyticus]MCZ8519447.1 hypothetical protein [Paenibacillus caseinilyticus]